MGAPTLYIEGLPLRGNSLYGGCERPPMTDETGASTPDPGLIDEAAVLIGTEGMWSGRILYTGVELGLFEVLDADPTSAAELAAQRDLDTDNTYRLLRAMAHFGVLDGAGRSPQASSSSSYSRSFSTSSWQ